MMAATGMIVPGSTLGILGGGQLAKMMAQAATRLGYRVIIYDPDPRAPAFAVAPHACGAWDDYQQVHDAVVSADLVSYEFENIPISCVEALARSKTIYPSPKVLAICQDRSLEKRFLTDARVAVAPYVLVNSPDELDSKVHELEVATGGSLIIKTTRGGYDGKAQIHLSPTSRLADIKPQLVTLLRSGPLIIEARIDFDFEVSQLVARNSTGQLVCYPLTYTRHRHGILDLAAAPVDFPAALARQAQQIARRIATRIGLVGIMAVEMFVTRSHQLLVNELAPRPHNSGHWSMDAGCCDQFEQWLRAVCNLPLARIQPQRAVIMRNLCGDQIRSWPQLMQTKSRLYIYGKQQIRPQRKMGHVNYLQARRRCKLSDLLSAPRSIIPPLDDK